MRWSQLEKRLNPSFDFKKAVERVLENKMTFQEVQHVIFMLRGSLSLMLLMTRRIGVKFRKGKIDLEPQHFLSEQVPLPG